MPTHHQPLDLAAARAKLDAARGQDYWRSLEELASTPEFQELLEHEFPRQAGEWGSGLSRRQFLTLAAASLGLAGLSGCVAPAPRERILPYVRAPEEIIPGRPLWFATAMPLGGDVQGLLVESHEGRPTKVDGNPDHPGSPRPGGNPATMRFGASDVYSQASVLGLYDPDRSQTVTHVGAVSTWEGFQGAFLALLAGAAAGRNGRNLRLHVLTETITSPSKAYLIRQVLKRFPAGAWHVHEPVNGDSAQAGARLAFGEVVEPQYRVASADVILALDADFLSCGADNVRHLHDFAERRRVRGGQTGRLNRLYVVESMPTGTGAVADHRLALRCADVEAFARALSAQLDDRFRNLAGAARPPVPAGFIEALARDLRAHPGHCLVIAGQRQPPVVHAIAHALNDALGSVGETVVYTAPAAVATPRGGNLRDLTEAMQRGQVDALVILGGNPAFTAPGGLGFAEALARVPFRAHLSLYNDETSELCQWHVPEQHYLESWGDARSHDGTVSLVQPLIAPLYGGKSALEVLHFLAERHDQAGYDLVRGYWRNLFGGQGAAAQAVRADWERLGLGGAFTGDFETWWHDTLRRGTALRTQAPPRQVTLRTEWLAPPQQAPAADLEIACQPDPAVYDGRFANNGWLQELPRPISKLTWDNAAYVSPATAIRLGLATEGHPDQANEKVIELSLHGQSVQAPVLVLPGHADNAITVHLGYGRRRAGRVGTGVGFDAYPLRTVAQPWFATGATVRDTGTRHDLAATRNHHLMHGRDLVRSGTVQHPPEMPPPVPRELTLYNETARRDVGHRWAMVIDTSVCTGCSACVVACQAENNIPVVGKDQVLRGREMHWLRVDAYFRSEDHEQPTANPEVYFQPVPCMHCETAPCEVVCPVGATVHSSDGLNDMVYNRCVGTRYCSNNCPYKVRRFNFLQYADFTTESLKLGRNPDVTVRSRGVMEKCTYCVQRIRAGEIDARRRGTPLRDGEVVTACQAACPAGAIVFGDLGPQGASGPPPSVVAGLKSEPLHYALLDELNTRPRTTYLAALKNPNPEIPPRPHG